MPPHSNEAEIAVIGAMMLDRSAVAGVVDILTADSFYSEIHRVIFDTMVSMFNLAIPVDIITLSEQLSKVDKLDFVGGIFYLTEINAKTPTAANIKRHARIIQEKFLKRMLIGTAGQILANAYDETTDALEEIDDAEAQIFKIAEKRFSKSYLPINKIAADTLKLITKLAESDKGLSGVASGLHHLDDLTGGFQNSDLIIVAGRPSMGKTALALSMARNAAVEYKTPVGIFSIEMSAVQLVMRLISGEAQVNGNDLRTGKIDRDATMPKIVHAIGRIADAPLIIDDSPSLSIMEFRAKARRMKAEHKIQMVVIDYLQLMHSPKAESREREISTISQSLKQVAKELNIPVIALSQLNRSVESRTDKRPMLSDLRESGSIEQDADIVCFVYRPEYYKIPAFANGDPTEGMAEIIIGKQRNGPVGTARVAYRKNFARFENAEVVRGEMPQDLGDPNSEPAF